MVGPDNGVLSLAWAQDGGVREAVSITSPDVLVHPVSPVLTCATFFAPGAAHLAGGADLALAWRAPGSRRARGHRDADARDQCRPVGR